MKTILHLSMSSYLNTSLFCFHNKRKSIRQLNKFLATQQRIISNYSLSEDIFTRGLENEIKLIIKLQIELETGIKKKRIRKRNFFFFFFSIADQRSKLKHIEISSYLEAHKPINKHINTSISFIIKFLPKRWRKEQFNNRIFIRCKQHDLSLHKETKTKKKNST